MGNPWDKKHGYNHNIKSHGDGLYRCTKCDKVATDEGRFSKTKCVERPK